MKQILCVVCGFTVLMLTGCTVSPSVLGNNVAGIGGAGISGNERAENAHSENSSAQQNPDSGFQVGAPTSTSSIVLLRDEGRVVDLPDASNQMQTSSAYQENNPRVMTQGPDGQTPESEQAMSPEERHRRELINRGDLQEGEPLPR